VPLLLLGLPLLLRRRDDGRCSGERRRSSPRRASPRPAGLRLRALPFLRSPLPRCTCSLPSLPRGSLSWRLRLRGGDGCRCFSSRSWRFAGWRLSSGVGASRGRFLSAAAAASALRPRLPAEPRDLLLLLLLPLLVLLLLVPLLLDDDGLLLRLPRRRLLRCLPSSRSLLSSRRLLPPSRPRPLSSSPDGLYRSGAASPLR
jgi:hypothetical protein